MSDKPKSTIADLEKMLDCADDRKSIEIRPNGEVVQLSTIESLEKNLRMAREENELLHTEIKRLRAQIGKAIDDLKASVHERQPLPLATLGAEGDGWGMSTLEYRSLEMLEWINRRYVCVECMNRGHDGKHAEDCGFYALIRELRSRRA